MNRPSTMPARKWITSPALTAACAGTCGKIRRSSTRVDGSNPAKELSSSNAKWNSQLMPTELPETLWGPLWRHMHNEHGLILVDDECNQIALAADEARMAAGTPVAMILINALRSLDQAELVTLGKAIADRCEHAFEPRDHIRDATKMVCETNSELSQPNRE
jgi:hypothetical protein